MSPPQSSQQYESVAAKNPHKLFGTINRPAAGENDLHGLLALLNCMDNIDTKSGSAPKLTQKNAFERTLRTYL